jgi:uncharacterized membrane protein
VALASLLGALYATYVIYFVFLSFGPLQIRIVDALLPLSVVFGWPAVVGVTIGCFIGNVVGSQIGPIDWVGGTLANFIAATLAWAVTRRQFRGRWLMAIGIEIATVSIIVGSYVVLFYAAPNAPLPALVVGWLEFLGSEVVAIGILGYPLLRAVDRAMTRNAGLMPRPASSSTETA